MGPDPPRRTDYASVSSVSKDRTIIAATFSMRWHEAPQRRPNVSHKRASVTRSEATGLGVYAPFTASRISVPCVGRYPLAV